MWFLLVNEAANIAGDPEFEARARDFFMWMAIIALVVTWLWLYLRIRQRMTPIEPPNETPGSPD